MTPPLRRLLVGLLLLVSEAALAKKGEDFPFFCSVEGTSHSFKVASDLRSPTGYALTLYRRNWVDASMPVEIGSTPDGKYWLIKGRRMAWSVVFDRQILAYIGATDGRASHGDVKTSLHTADGRDWDLKPLTCRR